ncbi:NHL repeat-containing protein [Novipirellula caenicola]|uniref:Non-specific serine/threonine protein kinase n=1 Tax=Novipirellula caenicola TaxID=1536901 RepID=A0ABP9VUP7_9BACT
MTNMLRKQSWIVFQFALAMVASASYAGDPPFPNELKYPNVVAPKFEFGTYGEAEGLFRDPSALLFADDSAVYVSDSGNNRIQKLTVDGKPLGAFTADGMLNPRGMEKTSTKTVLLVAEGSHEVLEFSESGVLQRRFGTFGHDHGQFDRPKDVAILDGNIAIADSGNCRIQFFTSDGEFLSAFGSHGINPGEFDDPTSLAVDSKGFIYVADAGNNRIQKFSSDGKFVKTWGGWGSHAGLFATPISVEVSGGLLYVADLVNHRLQAFNTDGKFLYQWGRHPPVAHEGNGRVHYPSSIAASPNGQYVAVIESFENRCQVFGFKSLNAVKQVDDNAWWEKATRFHYGTRVRAGETLLAISEPDTHSVLLFDNRGDVPELINRFGGQGNTFGRMVRPSGILITDAARGEFVASDSGNRRLQMFAAEPNPDPEAAGTFVKNAGKFVRAFGPPSSDLKLTDELDDSAPFFREPSAMANLSDGHILLCDPADHQVFEYEPGFKFVKRWGGKGKEQGQFDRPLDIAVASNDDIYIVDAYNFRIQVFDRDANFKREWGKAGSADGEFVSAFGIAIGDDDNVFVTDSATHKIQKFSKDGDFIKSWGSWGTGNGEFYKPKGIAVDGKGRVVVVDFGNHRAQMFDQGGEFLAAFGIGEEKNSPGY